MESIPAGLDSLLSRIISEVYCLFRLYRTRDGERKKFALFMKNVGNILESFKNSVPPQAEPVVRELADLVDVASVKLAKYAARGACSSAWHIRSETERMQSIMQGVQQLLPLLTVSVAPSSNVSAAMEDLQRRTASLHESSAEAAAHLSHLRDTIRTLAATNVTMPEVQQCMTTLRNSMLRLHEDSVEKVLEGCAALQGQLGAGLEEVMEAVDYLQLTVDSFSRQMLTLQRDMSADLEQIKGFLAKLCGIGSTAAQSILPARILAAIEEIDEADQDNGATTPTTNETWAIAIREAIVSGRLSVTSCLVLGVPLMPEGPLRPVTLPCCAFVVSRAGAEQLLQQGRCQVCHAPLASDAQLEDSDAVSMAVAAENHGFSPRIYRSSEVTVGSRIGSGGEGTVQEGILRGRSIAVKQIPLPAAAGRKEVASVNHVVSASYIAGVGSPHVCKLYGYCWTDTELWLLMELCDGSLADLVPVAKQQCKLPGLPPMDVVTLGLMLCSALDAVHRSARCLHLDVTPANVLLASAATNSAISAGADSNAGERHSVRLADFGLSKRLPSCVRTSLTTAKHHSLVKGVAKGAPGYAPKEQLLGTGQRRSDVYSLGATLLFATTGVPPYGGDTLQGILAKLLSNIAIDVPEYVGPPALKQVLTQMTAIEVEQRPSLAEVQQQLLVIHNTLLAQGAAPQFVLPVYDATAQAALPATAIAAAGPATAAASCSPEAPEVSAMQLPAEFATSDAQRSRAAACAAAPKSLLTESGESEDLGKEHDHAGHASLRLPNRSSLSDAASSQATLGLQSAAGSASAAAKASMATDVGASSCSMACLSETDLESTATSATPDNMHERTPDVAAGGESVKPNTGRSLQLPGRNLQTKIDSSVSVFHSERPSFPGRQPGATVNAPEDVCNTDSMEGLFSLLTTSTPGRTFSFEGAALTLTSGWMCEDDKPSASVGAAGGSSSRAVQLCRGGGTVADATLRLGDDGVMVFHGCSRAELRNVVIEGGSLVCSGPQCHVSLADVTLKRCGLHLSGGVTATIRGLRTQRRRGDFTSSLEGLGNALSAGGAGTTVQATDTHTDSAIYVHNGAAFTGDDLHVRVEGLCFSALVAYGKGTSVTLRKCEIVPRRRQGVPAGNSFGVNASYKARVSLEDCTVKQFRTGIVVGEGAHAFLQGGTVDAEDTGVHVSGTDTRVEAERSRIDGRKVAVRASRKTRTVFQQCEMGKIKKVFFW